MLPTKITRHTLAVFALAFATTAAAAPLFEQRASDLQAEVAAAARDGKTLAVLFEMHDCQPCAALKKNVFPDRSAVRRFGKEFRTVKVALDESTPLTDPQGTAQTPAALAGRYRVAGTPAIVFLDRQGRLLYRHLGPLADGRTLNLLGRFVRDAHYEQRPFNDFLRAQSTGALQKPAASSDHAGPHHPTGSHPS